MTWEQIQRQAFANAEASGRKAYVYRHETYGWIWTYSWVEFQLRYFRLHWVTPMERLRG